MDRDLMAILIFTLIVLAGVGGFFLLLPLSRRLGEFLEWRMRGQAGGADGSREAAQLRRQMDELSAQVARLEERQEFTESLLQARSREALPASGSK